MSDVCIKAQPLIDSSDAVAGLPASRMNRREAVLTAAAAVSPGSTTILVTATAAIRFLSNARTNGLRTLRFLYSQASGKAQMLESQGDVDRSWR